MTKPEQLAAESIEKFIKSGKRADIPAELLKELENQTELMDELAASLEDDITQMEDDITEMEDHISLMEKRVELLEKIGFLPAEKGKLPKK